MLYLYITLINILKFDNYCNMWDSVKTTNFKESLQRGGFNFQDDREFDYEENCFQMKMKSRVQKRVKSVEIFLL